VPSAGIVLLLALFYVAMVSRMALVKKLFIVLFSFVIYAIVVMSSQPFMQYNVSGTAKYLWNVTVPYRTVVNGTTVTTHTLVPATVETQILSPNEMGRPAFVMSVGILTVMSVPMFYVAVRLLERLAT